MSFPAIHKTLSTLDTLQKQVLTQNVIVILQDLLKSLQSAIDEIHHSALRIDKYKQFQSKTKLCASQLTKALPSLVDIMKGAQNSAHKEVSDFLIEKIRWCLLEVLRLFSGGGSEGDGEPSGLFVKMMDDVIMKLQKDGHIDSSFRETVDELLCQALTIAKLSAREDHDSISAGCKNVLMALSDVSDFTKSAANSFQIDALQTALELLERRVNLAVLRIFLQIAADPNLPLKQLTLKALDKRYTPRHADDLSADLEFLDLYCEKIQLMGNFAVACSNDSQLKVKILCCLASIEFCENFFLPSAEEFYITPSDFNKKGFFKFIVDEYQKEMKELTQLLDCVVDTETFVSVALSDLSPLVEDIRISVLNNIFHKRDAEVFLSRCVRLLKHLNATSDESVVSNVRLTEAVKEFETILAKHQICLRWNILTVRSMQDVLSKMESALHSIQKISCLITVSRNAVHTADTPQNKMRLRRTTFVGNITYTPDNTVLKPYIARVQGTPRMKSSLYVVTPKKTPRACPRNATNNTITNISEILENIRDVPDSFSSNASMRDDLVEEDAAERRQTAGADEFDLTSLAASHASRDTLGRIEDILLLDDKINKLKMV